MTPPPPEPHHVQKLAELYTTKYEQGTPPTKARAGEGGGVTRSYK